MERPVEDEVIYEEASSDTDNQDTDANSHPEVPEYQDAEAITHHEITFAGSIYDGNTQKTRQYVSTIDIYIKNVD